MAEQDGLLEVGATVTFPGVTVLMATWNAAEWLPDQLASIYAQEQVTVSLIVSDDQSADGTVQLLQHEGAKGRLTLMPRQERRFGNANRNFVHLVLEAEIGQSDYVALADHDDVWMPRKLARAVACIEANGLDAYSSDVVAFWEDGRTRLLGKARPLCAFDHLFESAGPGCTFVLRRAAFEALRGFLRQHRVRAEGVKVHDWLFYAFGRAAGWRWRIDPEPGIRYRQHAGNEIGANIGWRAVRGRWRQIRSGEYRLHALQIADLVCDGSWVTRRLRRFDLADRIALALGASQCRRAPREALALAFFFLFMKRV